MYGNLDTPMINTKKVLPDKKDTYNCEIAEEEINEEDLFNNIRIIK